MPDSASLATVHAVLRGVAPLTGFLHVVEHAEAEPQWIARAALCAPDAAPLALLLAGAAAPALGERESRRAAAAWFMLRFGWSSGHAIAVHLVHGQALQVLDYALRFPAEGGIDAVCLRDAELAPAASPAEAREQLLDALVACTAPVLDALQRWSGASRAALWAMVTSSWASHFIHMGQQLGDESRGRREAESLFALRPEIQRAAPRLFTVSGGGLEGVCQVRRGCCRNHRRPEGKHCASCPLLAEDTRLLRYRQWVIARPLRRAPGLTFARSAAAETMRVDTKIFSK